MKDLIIAELEERKVEVKEEIEILEEKKKLLSMDVDNLKKRKELLNVDIDNLGKKKTELIKEELKAILRDDRREELKEIFEAV